MTKSSKNYLMPAVLLTLAAIFVLLTASQAWAAAIATPDGETGLRVDASEYATWGAGVLATLGITLWGVIKGVLPGPARWIVQVTQLDQVIENTIRSWISQNVGDKASKAVFTVDMRNKAARDIAAMALNTGNKFVLKARSSLVDKVHARLEKYIQENYGSGAG